MAADEAKLTNVREVCVAAPLTVGADRRSDRRRLLAALICTLPIIGLEVVGGLWTGSLALLSDAGHMVTDAAALLLSLAAVWVATRPADVKRTYGYYRFEILCALVNGAVLVPISVGIVVEAIRRFPAPPEVRPVPMIAIAAVGLLANGLVYLVLRRSRSMNVRGALLHVAADAASSVGVVAAGLLILATGWRWVDPAVSVAIAAVIVVSAFRLMREAVDVLLEAVPAHLDLAEVLRAIEAVDGVAEVHDLHIWTLSSAIHALSAHLVVKPASVGQNDAILARVQAMLRERFAIEHATLQIESSSFARVDHAR